MIPLPQKYSTEAVEMEMEEEKKKRLEELRVFTCRYPANFPDEEFLISVIDELTEEIEQLNIKIKGLTHADK